MKVLLFLCSLNLFCYLSLDCFLELLNLNSLFLEILLCLLIKLILKNFLRLIFFPFLFLYFHYLNPGLNWIFCRFDLLYFYLLDWMFLLKLIIVSKIQSYIAFFLKFQIQISDNLVCSWSWNLQNTSDLFYTHKHILFHNFFSSFPVTYASFSKARMLWG